MTEFERDLMFQTALRQIAARRAEAAVPLVKPVAVVTVRVLDAA